MDLLLDMTIPRRSFFKSLAMLGAAAAGCPGIFVPKFEPVRWKVVNALNPAYTDCQHTMIVNTYYVDRNFYGTWKWILNDEGFWVNYEKANPAP